MSSSSQRLNTVLETLDMSGNPCCGPTLEGVRRRCTVVADAGQIAALRTTFAQNTSLVRVFLNGTDLRSEGAISLAEFLPDIKTLLHLDLTENYEVPQHAVGSVADMPDRHRRSDGARGRAADELHDALPRPQHPSALRRARQVAD